MMADELNSRPATAAPALSPASTMAATLMGALLAACGGGGGGDSPPPVTQPEPPKPAFALAVKEVASGLSTPLLLTAPAGDTRRFIVERPGRIRILASDGSLRATPFLDLTGLLSTDGEGGLLSMAFHPGYAQNGRFFIYYTDKFSNIAIDEVKVSANADIADAGTLKRIITIPHPTYTNHYGGMLAFGADGYLYAGTGDGGGAGDPGGNAQNLDSLLGKLLRLKVDDVVAPLYNVPSDNPFVGQAGKRGEIWAYGLRNPWRFAFDSATASLYVADVGQELREEVNVVPAGLKPANYGWNIMEGGSCYNAATCSQQGLTLPVFDYQHGANNANGCSITGGFVYRGTALPELAGRYLYSDYCKGFLKSFLYTNGAVSDSKDWAVGDIGQVPGFGQDAAGELYITSANGKVYQIIRKP
ncbi:sorbosone dehydrogenase family protein [Duganella sp. Root198D2]|uniref:PQQ-dependent sugar dehydrogenase n=1 Tax=Duganella sp. Root198D2 TaxID=1736489 RepID=UPI0009E90890|nr:PQQ-dependent sugar dehydrogenase [Duganella sp. Root198D2]